MLLKASIKELDNEKTERLCADSRIFTLDEKIEANRKMAQWLEQRMEFAQQKSKAKGVMNGARRSSQETIRRIFDGKYHR